ncbi:capsid cement protein [Mesorhizobium sp. NZP2077]|uniref:DUF2190 family protein n=1 Tax=Mesorhizobium sp. NZP2077 TaxID=2483404 RepID=UPI001557D2C7|nr:capsid cement protein [Mesorhizobium sp. NZP2077]QKC83267.1 DUF2190 family protein [Mesorhizobium sp. NZP2077]QKD16783.1 DUF2190 family protein [Mesorhizobium sp. NZP2077]
MKNYIGPGSTIPWTNDGDAAVASGDGVMAGALFGVAQTDIAVGEAGELALTGVWILPKPENEDWTVGQRVYWDAGQATATEGDNLIGVAVEISGEAAGKVRLSAAFIGAGGGGGGGRILYLGEALTVDGEPLLSGTDDDMELVDALAALGAIVNPDTQQWGFGVADISELQPARLTVKPTEGGLGSELVSNGSFTGNADGWSLSEGWAYGGNKVTRTPGVEDAGFDQANLATVKNTEYRITGTISGASGIWTLRVAMGAANATLTENGDFSVTLFYSNDTGQGDVQFASLDDTFNGSIDSVSVNQILDITTFALLHNNGDLAITFDTSLNNSTEVSKFKVNSNDNITIQPGNYFGLRQNPQDGDQITFIDHYNASQERTIGLPDGDGDVALANGASDTFTTVDLKTVTVDGGIVSNIAS